MQQLDQGCTLADKELNVIKNQQVNSAIFLAEVRQTRGSQGLSEGGRKLLGGDIYRVHMPMATFGFTPDGLQ